eukprot:TRINITY_DN3849_c0_g1_i2.p1 TRINITY_DN3849_c0_g1~~TRINITY_DN3849_c0_g1_i2.p1  ORF type:complete len:275 (+),score=39.65 TRINITY_DN3849_c0_g1_i2:78-902(+)
MLKTLHCLEEKIYKGVVTKNKSRRLTHIRGLDTYKFLNGLTTVKIEKTRESVPQYGTFLSIKGKIMFDAMFYHRANVGSYFVEVDTDVVDSFYQHLNKYKLRSMVDFEDHIAKAYDLWTVTAIDIESRDLLLRNLLNVGELGNNLHIYIDPRWDLNLRLIVPKNEQPPLDGIPDLIWQEDDDTLYEYLRILNGIPEGQTELIHDKQMPLEANLVEIGGLDLDKGCYIGQELVARTHFQGQIRKRYEFDILVNTIYNQLYSYNIGYSQLELYLQR